MHSFDIELLITAIAQRLSCGFNTAGNRGIGDDPAAPHSLHKLIAAEQGIRVLCKMNQKIEHQRLDIDLLAIPAQFITVGIDFDICKSEH
jgi:hypothetical protein